MAMKEKRERQMKILKGKEDKELLVTSSKEVQKVKNVHKPLYLLLPHLQNSMKVEKFKRQSMEFSISNHFDLSSTIVPFSLNINHCRGIVDIQIPKILIREGKRNKNIT